MNKILIIGRLTRDPELRYSDKGVAVVMFTLAVNDKRGENQIAYFFSCICFAGVAEALARYMQKGNRIAVEGKLTQYKKQEKDWPSTRITCEAIEFLESGKTPKSETEQSDNRTTEKPKIDDEDIPF